MTAEECAAQIRAELGEVWLPLVYRERVLKIRTRSYDFGATSRNARVCIQHTLLGIELQIGKRRLLCPDLATARYLSIFARAGCQTVAVPYDITKISRLADELESSWQRMLLLAEQYAGNRSATFKTRIRRLLIAEISRGVSSQ